MSESYRTPPIVMDTNVLVAGACRRSPRLAHRTLMGVLRSEIPLMLTTAIALEYLDVLQRPRVLEITGLNHSQSAELVTDLIEKSKQIQLHFNWRPNLDDEGDNKFMEAAIRAAAILVTYNKNHFRFPDLQGIRWRAMTPRELVTRYL